MTFDFSGIKANLEGINQYLKSQGMELSDTDAKNLESIFREVDKTVHKENEKGYKDGFLDWLEQREFITQIKVFVNNNLHNKISEFFDKLNQFYIDKNRKEIPAEQPDALGVKLTIEEETNDIATNNIQLNLAKKYTLNKPIKSSTTIVQSPPIEYDMELMNQAVNNIVGGNSVLKNKASAFINYAQSNQKKYQLDPIFLMALSMHESARGTSNAAKNKNNVGGIMGQNGLRKFNTVEECIDSIANTINKRVNEGYTTINKVAYSGRYCRKDVAPNWSKEVVWFAEQIRNEYNRLLQEKYA